MECLYSGLPVLPRPIVKPFRARVSVVLQSRIFAKLGFDEVSLSFVRDRAMRILNRDYRGKDKATDVLSFAHDGEDAVRSPSLGDIVISIDTAKRQSKEFRVSLLDELTRLFIHGMLHCAGYDHENVSRAEAVRMFRTQNYIMTRVVRSQAERVRSVANRGAAKKRTDRSLRRKQARSSSLRAARSPGQRR